jgi:hypothetical protein
MELLPRRKVKIAGAVLAMAGVFFILTFALHEVAESRVMSFDGFTQSYIAPHLFNPLEWRVIVDEGGMFMVSDYGFFSGMSSGVEISFHIDEKVEASKKSELVNTYIKMSKIPFATVEGNKVQWYDLRLSDDGEIGYTVIVTLDDDLNVIEERVGF